MKFQLCDEEEDFKALKSSSSYFCISFTLYKMLTFLVFSTEKATFFIFRSRAPYLVKISSTFHPFFSSTNTLLNELKQLRKVNKDNIIDRSLFSLVTL